MYNKTITDFICKCRNNNSCVNALVEHIRVSMPEPIVTRVLEMMILSKEEFINAYGNIEGKIDINKLTEYIKTRNNDKEFIKITNINSIDVVTGVIEVEYRYQRTLWFEDNDGDMTGDYSYQKDDTHQYGRLSDKEYTTYSSVNYYEVDVLKDK